VEKQFLPKIFSAGRSGNLRNGGSPDSRINKSGETPKYFIIGMNIAWFKNGFT